jgi:hypothetical protein
MYINLHNLLQFVITSLHSFNRLSKQKPFTVALGSYERGQVDDEWWRFATSEAFDAAQHLCTEFCWEVTLDALHKKSKDYH